MPSPEVFCTDFDSRVTSANEYWFVQNLSTPLTFLADRVPNKQSILKQTLPVYTVPVSSVSGSAVPHVGDELGGFRLVLPGGANP
jgi:hypothetical protein